MSGDKPKGRGDDKSTKTGSVPPPAPKDDRPNRPRDPGRESTRSQQDDWEYRDS